MSFRKIFLIPVILLSFVAGAQSDHRQDSIDAVFSARAPYFNHTQLYLHLDKSIYVNSENIWFAAYLLRGVFPLEKYNTLHVVLSDRLTNRVVASERFVMTAGLSAGNIFIPDSLKAGDYNLIAYTNTFAEEPFPQPFTQQVNIRAAGSDPFTISFEKTMPAGQRRDSISIMCRIVNSESLYAKNAQAKYKILADDKIILSDSATINQYGELPITFPFSPTARKFELVAQIKTATTSFATKLAIPAYDGIYFNWYPEGGDLIDGIPGRVAFKATLATGQPASLKGMLLENGQPIGKMQANAAGLGIVEFTPHADKKYTVKLETDNNVVTQLNFPPLKTGGYAMRINEGVVNDTMVINLNSSGTGNKVALMIHDYQQVLQYTPINFERNSVIVKVPTAPLPRGLMTITLVDSLGSPTAERTIFNGYHQIPFLEITTDSTQYHTRSKVTLKVKATDRNGQPMQTSFSMAGVYAKRIDTLNYQDIVPYSLFNTYIEQGLITRSSLYNLGNPGDLEMFLLTHCWTRYKTPLPDTISRASLKNISLAWKGKVTPKTKRGKLPVEVIVMKSKGMNIVPTDETGHFELSPDIAELAPDDNLNIFLNKKNTDDYTLSFDESEKILEEKLAARSYPEPVLVKAVLPEEEKAALASIKTLSTAVVKSRSSNADTAVYRSTTCNDYFCMYNILNCKNHPWGTPAVNGQYYVIRGVLTLYQCPGAQQQQESLLRKIKGRYYAKDFFVADYANFNPPEQELHSTIYWTPPLLTNEHGEAEVSFYTNDLPGIFLCIAEGISNNGVISGKKTIRVIK